MITRFIYSQAECNRIIPSVLIDARSGIPEIKGKTGFQIKAFTDAQAAMVTPATIFYRMETTSGNLAGYCTLAVVRTGVASILQFELRPAFEQFRLEISANLSSFIASGKWSYDTLL